MENNHHTTSSSCMKVVVVPLVSSELGYLRPLLGCNMAMLLLLPLLLCIKIAADAAVKVIGMSPR